ncbi:MAG: biopolymer transporter ExbD [Phycisphaerae bacterium]|nr:biopolymer transporter ExbD [Phycisphaerae bacterium]
MADKLSLTQRIRSADAKSLQRVEATETVHHESKGRKRRRPKGVQELNLTSMLDVCFQLLIFFILTASFAKGEGYLPADLPTGQGEKSDTDKPPEQPIEITLRSLGDGAVSIQISISPNPPGNFSELQAHLKSARHGPSNPAGVYNKDDPIIIKPDPTVPWVHVMDAYNQCVAAKYENINFAQAK